MKTRSLVVILLGIQPLVAGPLTIVSFVPHEVVRFTTQAAGRSQEIALGYGEDSGSFLLPDDSKATITASTEGLAQLELQGSPDGHLAIAYKDSEDQVRWFVAPSKPNYEEWTLRAVNLGPGPVTLSHGGAEHVLEPEQVVPIELAGNRPQALVIKDGEVHSSLKLKEVTAMLAVLIYREEEWRIFWVADR